MLLDQMRADVQVEFINGIVLRPVHLPKVNVGRVIRVADEKLKLIKWMNAKTPELTLCLQTAPKSSSFAAPSHSPDRSVECLIP